MRSHGVPPTAFRVIGSAPARTRAVTTSALPSLAAECSGVLSTALKRCALVGGLDLYLWVVYRTFALRAPLRAL